MFSAYIRAFFINSASPAVRVKVKTVIICKPYKGEYLVFVYNPISNQQLSEVIREMESQGKNIATDPQKNYLIVRRIPFLQAGGFSGGK